MDVTPLFSYSLTLIIPFFFSLLISPPLLSLPRFYKPIFGAFTTVKAMADWHCRPYGGKLDLVVADWSYLNNHGEF